MFCACGCGERLTPFDERGRPRRFIYHHHARTMTEKPWKAKPDSENWRTGRGRAQEMTDTSRCELEQIGGCKGKIDVHHKNRDPMDNSVENRMALCRTHHRLVDLGRIDLANPAMPEFVIRAGKRRYLYRYSATTRSEARKLVWARRKAAGLGRSGALRL